jgi:hypothetical protein
MNFIRNRSEGDETRTRDGHLRSYSLISIIFVRLRPLTGAESDTDDDLSRMTRLGNIRPERQRSLLFL